MKLRPAPAVATWFLKLFCSDVEYEALVGDLTEQYQQGRGRFWYWRQVLDIVFLALYSKAARRPLTSAPRARILATIGSILLIAAISVAVLLSNIASILLVGVLAGVFFGFVKFGRSDSGRAAPTQINPPAVARIDSSKISISGGAGAGIVILMLLGAALIELPELRLMAVPGILAGLVVAVVLRLWRKLHPRDISKEWVSIKSK